MVETTESDFSWATPLVAWDGPNVRSDSDSALVNALNIVSGCVVGIGGGLIAARAREEKENFWRWKKKSEKLTSPDSIV